MFSVCKGAHLTVDAAPIEEKLAQSSLACHAHASVLLLTLCDTRASQARLNIVLESSAGTAAGECLLTGLSAGGGTTCGTFLCTGTATVAVCEFVVRTSATSPSSCV